MVGNNALELIAEIIGRRGAESYLGEKVTMSEHMLQSAQLAEQEDGRLEMVAAALLHDIGHYSNEFDDDALERGINNFHDQAGADIVEGHFPVRVADCIRYHVEAKRYLCRVQPEYFQQLSPASVHTLSLQGGPMTDVEAAAFAGQPHLEDILRLRRWDERAKVAGLKTGSLDYYLEMITPIISN